MNALIDIYGNETDFSELIADINKVKRLVQSAVLLMCS